MKIFSKSSLLLLTAAAAVAAQAADLPYVAPEKVEKLPINAKLTAGGAVEVPARFTRA